MDIVEIWPLFGLRIETPRLVLRPVRDDDLPGLAGAALDGIHDAGRTPFGVPWTDAPTAELPRNLATFQWGLRTRVAPNDWVIAFAVFRDGVLIGAQDLSARDFLNRRTVQSGSWLTTSAQGQGVGTEMRAALLLFAFDMLGAQWAESSAAAWNEASLGVSRTLGYEPNGVTRVSPRPGQPVDEQRMRLSRDAFNRPSWNITTRGVERVLDQLGIAGSRDV